MKLNHLRVLHLLGNHRRIGGIIPVVEAMISVQASEPIQHNVLFHRNYSDLDFSHPGEIVRTPGILDDGPNHLRLLFGALAALPTVRRYVSREPHTILQSHTRGGMLVAMAMYRLHGTPIVFSHHTYGRNKNRYRWGVNCPKIRHVYLTEHMRNYYDAGNHPHSRVISECVADDFGLDIVTSRGDSSDARIHLLGLGTLTERKRWHLIPEALGLLAPAVRDRLRVDIFGDSTEPAYRSSLLSTVAAAGVFGSFHLHDRNNDVPSLLATADCFIFPSVLEPCSVALIEALAAGVPALAARSGGTTEIVHEPRGGRLFSPDDPSDLARQLERLVVDPDFLPPRETVRSVVEKRRAFFTSGQYLEIYFDVLQEEGA